jgi:dTDP-4-dehydrorhamnose reductase
MKVAVTGAAGQLGTDLCRCLRDSGHEAVALTRRDLDLAHSDQVRETISALAPDWVVNCAAYTQVDRAESEAEQAFAVNRDGARALAQAVARTSGRLLQVSTDFVFDGSQSHPYREEDAASPLGVYGHSKWEGEQAVLDCLPGVLIVRTAWVHGAHGQNFVKTILRLASERERLTIVDDQVGSPSWTGDIATALVCLMEQQAAGIFHYTNEGVASWYDFAWAILEEARGLGLLAKDCELVPIPTSAYPTPARRPAYSVLSKEKIRACLGTAIPHWREGLQSMMRELKA